jgi:xylan 1,4-beta-xylosidase
MLWNYADDDVASEPTPVHLTAQGIPATVRRVLLEEYRIDGTHSNAYAVWKQMGSPQEPIADQISQLKLAGQLQLVGSPEWVTVDGGRVEIHLEQPLESVSLVRVSWNSATSR